MHAILLFYESFKSLEKRALSEIKECKTVLPWLFLSNLNKGWMDVSGQEGREQQANLRNPSPPLPFHSVPPMLLKASGNFKVNRGGYNFFVCGYFL